MRLYSLQRLAKAGVTTTEYVLLLGSITALVMGLVQLFGSSFVDLSYSFGQTLATALPFLGLSPPPPKPAAVTAWQFDNSSAASSRRTTAKPMASVISILSPTANGGNLAASPSQTGDASGSSASQQRSIRSRQRKSGGTSGTAPQGAGYYNITSNPKTGAPTLTLVDVSTLSTNVTSVDGNQRNTMTGTVQNLATNPNNNQKLTSYYQNTMMGTVQAANYIQNLATNPNNNQKLTSYYQSMANLAYYMGGAEGTLDNVPRLAVTSAGNQKPYTNGDALRDINQYKNQLNTLLKNPPKGLSAGAYRELLTYAVQAHNIAQNYVNRYGRFMDGEGNVSRNFGNPELCSYTACMIGDGMPGSSLANADQADYTDSAPTMSGAEYADVVNLKRLKLVAAQVVEDSRLLALAGDGNGSGDAGSAAMKSLAGEALHKTAMPTLSASGSTPFGSSQTEFSILIALIATAILGGALFYKYNPFKDPD
jgi:hypothetical protein